MKSYTDLEQSKKLAEILPPESADMWWDWFSNPLDDVSGGEYITEPLLHKPVSNPEKIIPCWSLAALLNILPKQFGQYTITLYRFKNAWNCDYTDEDFESEVSMSANNPVDACFEMVFELKRLIDNNLL